LAGRSPRLSLASPRPALAQSLPAHGMEAAARFYQARDLAEAERCCREMVDSTPANVDALHLLGVIHLDRAGLDQAIDLLTKTAAAMPGDAKVHYHLGNALLAAERWQEAEAALSRSLDLDPTDARAGNNLGRALAGRERHDEAVACYRRLLAVNADDL